MAGKNATHKHRNIIDDILDLGLTIASIAWYFTGVELDAETVAMIAGAGAGARATLRRILTKMWGDKLGIEAPAEDSASDDADSDPSDPYRVESLFALWRQASASASSFSWWEAFRAYRNKSYLHELRLRC